MNNKHNGRLIHEFISEEEEQKLIASIDKEPWLRDLKRRVQHYGYKYDYRARTIDKSMKIGELPTWSKDIAKRIKREFFNGKAPDQLIVNEYNRGQGIGQHIDRTTCFGDTIVSISLISPCIIDFLPQKGAPRGSTEINLRLDPRDCLILQGRSRYNWSHGIKTHNERRISLTFRTIII